MIATHNIKVGGRWVKAGEEYQPEEVAKKAKKAVEPEKQTEKKPEEKPAKETQKAEPAKEETKAKTSPSRRKKISE